MISTIDSVTQASKYLESKKKSGLFFSPTKDNIKTYISIQKTINKGGYENNLEIVLHQLLFWKIGAGEQI